MTGERGSSCGRPAIVPTLYSAVQCGRRNVLVGSLCSGAARRGVSGPTPPMLVSQIGAKERQEG